MAMVTDRYCPIPDVMLMSKFICGTVMVNVQGLDLTTVTWQPLTSTDSFPLASLASPFTDTLAVRGVGLYTLIDLSYRLTNTLAMHASELLGCGQSTSLICFEHGR